MNEVIKYLGDYMKTIGTLLLCFILLFGSCFSASAYDGDSTKQTNIQTIVMEDGSEVVVTEELIINDSARASTRSATKRQSFTKNGTTIAVIALTAEFSYTGSTVSVVSKELSECTLYNNWSYSQTSLTSSGGTVTLSAKLKKLLNTSVPVSISITCDKNGNIS